MKNRFIPNIQLFAEGGEEKKFTQEDVNKMIEERVAREKKKFETEKKELERKHGETIEEYEERIKNANLTAEEKHKKELEKIQKDLEEKNAELSTIKTNELKKAALVKYKLPESFLTSISGTTEEEIENSVKAFSENIGAYMKSHTAGTPDALNGGSGGDTDKKVLLDNLKKKAMETGEAEDRAAYVKLKNELESGGNQ